jgi:hypothetical protein
MHKIEALRNRNPHLVSNVEQIICMHSLLK